MHKQIGQNLKRCYANQLHRFSKLIRIKWHSGPTSSQLTPSLAPTIRRESRGPPPTPSGCRFGSWRRRKKGAENWAKRTWLSHPRRKMRRRQRTSHQTSCAGSPLTSLLGKRDERVHKFMIKRKKKKNNLKSIGVSDRMGGQGQ